MAVVIDLSKPVNWSEVSIIAAEAAGWKVETAKRVEKVFVWPRTDRTTYVNQGEPFVVHQDGTRLTVPPYAEDDSAAWSLIQLMIRQGFRPEIRLEQDGKWHVALHKQDEDTQVVYEASHESFAKAAVLAVVQAAGVRVLSDAFGKIRDEVRKLAESSPEWVKNHVQKVWQEYSTSEQATEQP